LGSSINSNVIGLRVVCLVMIAKILSWDSFSLTAGLTINGAFSAL
jgi:hypothetical protein